MTDREKRLREIRERLNVAQRDWFQDGEDAVDELVRDIPFLLSEIERLEKKIPEFDYMHGIRSWSIAEPQSLDDAKRQLSEIRRMTAEHYGIDE